MTPRSAARAGQLTRPRNHLSQVLRTNSCRGPRVRRHCNDPHRPFGCRRSWRYDAQPSDVCIRASRTRATSSGGGIAAMSSLIWDARCRYSGLDSKRWMRVRTELRSTSGARSTSRGPAPHYAHSSGSSSGTPQWVASITAARRTIHASSRRHVDAMADTCLHCSRRCAPPATSTSTP
jgi:hypothetical protein